MSPSAEWYEQMILREAEMLDELRAEEARLRAAAAAAQPPSDDDLDESAECVS